MINNPYKNLTSKLDWEKFFTLSLESNGYSSDNDTFLTETDSVRFVHFSPHTEKITKHGSIAVSGGGLFGVVYVTPLRNNNEVHNLGRYIFETEMTQRGQVACNKCLVFEIQNDDYFRSIKNGALNYVIDSKIYCGCSILSPKDNAFLDRVYDATRSFISKLNEFSALDFSLWDQTTKYFKDSPFMKHVFFESINEYLYIKQDSEESFRSARKGEVYAKNIKDYQSLTSPILRKKFSTELFETDLRVHINKLGKEGGKIIKHYNPDDFMQFMQARLSFYLLTMINKTDHSPITGRFILKNTPSEKRYIVEQCGAEKIWKTATDFSALHYSVIPKGEWGIMPMTNRVKTYSGQYVDGSIKNIQPIKLKIENRILNNTESVLRVKI